MREALDKEGIKKHLMIQPIAFKTPECSHNEYGFTGLQEFPFGKSVAVQQLKSSNFCLATLFLCKILHFTKSLHF